MRNKLHFNVFNLNTSTSFSIHRIFITFFLTYLTLLVECRLNSTSNEKEFDGNASQKCPFICRLTSTAQDEVECINAVPFKNEKSFKEIRCTLMPENLQYVIGNKTSVRRIVPAGLKILSSLLNVQFPGRGNLIDVYLNMNILELGEDALTGLENILYKIQIFNVHRLHPDTFLNSKRLTSIIIDSFTVPETTSIVQSAGISKSRNFIRFHPEDTSYPLATNIDVRCHKCAHMANDSDHTIITFPDGRNFHADSSLIDSISLTYFDSCQRIINGLGCRQVMFNKNNESYFVNNSTSVYIIDASAPNGWDNELLASSSVQSAYNRYSEPKTKILTTWLIVWCSFISLILLILFLWIFICRKKFKMSDWKNSRNLECVKKNVLLKKIIHKSTSCEDWNIRSRPSECNGNLAYETPSLRSTSIYPAETFHRWDIECTEDEILNNYSTKGVASENGEYNQSWRVSDGYSPARRSSISRENSAVDYKSLFQNGGTDNLLFDGAIDGKKTHNNNVQYIKKVTPYYKRSKDGIFQLSR